MVRMCNSGRTNCEFPRLRFAGVFPGLPRTNLLDPGFGRRATTRPFCGGSLLPFPAKDRVWISQAQPSFHFSRDSTWTRPGGGPGSTVLRCEQAKERFR
jgi:hypothetical protein